MSHDLENIPRDRSRDSQLLRRLVGLMAPYKLLVALSFALLPAVALIHLTQPYLLKLAVDGALLKGDRAKLATFVALYVLSLLIECVLRFAQNYTTQFAGQRFTFDLRKRLYAKLLAHSAPFHDKNPASRLMTRVTSDVESLNALFTSGVVAVASDGVTILAISAMLLWLDWRLSLFCFGMLPLLAPVLLRFRGLMREVFHTAKTLLSRLNAYLGEVVSGIRVVQLFNREARNAREYGELNRQFKEAYHKSNLYEASLYSIVELASRLSIAGLIWYGGRSILEGAMSFGTLVAAVEYTTGLFNPIRDLSAKFAILQSALASAERIFDVLDAPIEIHWRETARAETFRGEVRFDAVRFQYRPGEDVIHELTAHIRAGEHVAVVGATGAGKSTFMKLLSRFYDPAAGSIAIDGVDLTEMDAKTLRRTVNVVLQDVFIFGGTVADNITLGDASISRDRVVEAARSVNAERFIERLGGYDAEVRERGSNLSAGERQLLSFARALVLDPRNLILDEATSSVDSETEHVIQQALARVMEGRTTIVIAHRLSTIRHADRILVLHKGRLVEEGTHASLLRQRGIYRRLYELQYKDQEEEQPAADAGASPGGSASGGDAATESTAEDTDAAVTVPPESAGAEAVPAS
ncbi:MAG: ABC transporter ATP-binding protein [Candidatus Wallbacteria bacterium]|nr:ABC transporter ATP-binding protein [Candidatus Wallbacteria bacterium]